MISTINGHPAYPRFCTDSSIPRFTGSVVNRQERKNRKKRNDKRKKETTKKRRNETKQGKKKRGREEATKRGGKKGKERNQGDIQREKREEYVLHNKSKGAKRKGTKLTGEKEQREEGGEAREINNETGYCTCFVSFPQNARKKAFIIFRDAKTRRWMHRESLSIRLHTLLIDY